MDSLRASFMSKKPDSDNEKSVLKKTPPSNHSLPTTLTMTPATAATTTTSSTGPPQKSNSTSSKSSASQKSILKSPSTSSSSSKKSVILPIANTDSLPTGVMDLEGRLNHHTSQLQQLADRVERINEWIEMDEIVLRRLAKDAEVAAEEEKKHKGERVTVATGTSGVPQLAFTAPGGRKEEVPASEAVVEVRERVKGMKRWRKELERAVVWQREEHWRVEKTMGRTGSRKPRFVVVNQGEGDEGAEGGEKTVVGTYARERWVGGAGRLPTQGEWEELFGNGGGMR